MHILNSSSLTIPSIIHSIYIIFEYILKTSVLYFNKTRILIAVNFVYNIWSKIGVILIKFFCSLKLSDDIVLENTIAEIK